MWNTGSGQETSNSSEDEEAVQCEILEKERDEANRKLSEMEQVSQKLLKEMEVLEIQFQVERSCRENAESTAVKLTKENKVLKRMSKLLPVPELPENVEWTKPGTDADLDGPPDHDTSSESVLQYQAQLRDMQGSLDQLLGDKMHLAEQVEALRREQAQLEEQLTLEIGEKEAAMRKLDKQDRAVNKMKRVSQLVSQEFNNMSQKLDLEHGLRKHAEVFAHQMLLRQKEMQRQSMMMVENTQMGTQLQQALDQVAKISKSLGEINLWYQNQIQTGVDEGSAISELQAVQQQLEASEAERKVLQEQLRDSQSTARRLQEEVQSLQEGMKVYAGPSQIESREQDSIAGPTQTVPPPPPPPPPLPPPCINVTDPLEALRNRRKASEGAKDLKAPGTPSMQDMKARAVDEMMERIKKGIVLRPAQKPQQLGPEDDSAWWADREEKRKSAVYELQEMLGSMNRRSRRRGSTRKRISRHVGETELQMVLLRRRRAMGDEQERHTLPQTQDQNPAAPASNSLPWVCEAGNTPVLRRLKQNGENRNSRIRASEGVIWENS